MLTASTEYWTRKDGEYYARGVLRFERWERYDGAVVANHEFTHHDPSNPNADVRCFVAFPPDSDRYLGFWRGHFYVPRRWKTAAAAMAAVDREFPPPPARRR